MLHLKRPRVFPVLDEFVVRAMGVNLPGGPKREQRIAIEQRITAAIRREGRTPHNLDALRAIQAEVAKPDFRLSLIRILDICLWFSHPAAGVPSAAREISVGLRA